MDEATAAPVLAPLTGEQETELLEAFDEIRANGFYVKLAGTEENLALEIHEQMIDPDSIRYLLGVIDRFTLRPYIFQTSGPGQAPLVLHPIRVPAGEPAAAAEEPTLALAPDETAAGDAEERYVVAEREEDGVLMMNLAFEHGTEIHRHDFVVPSPDLAELTWEAAEEVGRRVADAVSVEDDDEDFEEEFVKQVKIGTEAIARAAALRAGAV